MNEQLPCINEQQIIIISDTHIGSIYENISYLEKVYDYATIHSIHHIIHTGDLIQSTYLHHHKKYYNEETQIHHLLDIYPFNPQILTYLLFGNHDYHSINKDSQYLSMILSRPDFINTGIRDSIIIWQNQTIGLHHHCSRYTINIPSLKKLITFCGHSHKLSIPSPEKIYVPTLSDDLKNSTQPGFLVASITSNTLYIEHIALMPDLENKGLILKKALKDDILI